MDGWMEMSFSFPTFKTTTYVQFTYEKLFHINPQLKKKNISV